MHKKHILFFIRKTDEKVAAIYHFICYNKNKIDKIVAILEEEFNNLFFYDPTTGYMVYTSGWVKDRQIADIHERNFSSARSFFDCISRKDLLNCSVMSDILTILD